MSMRKVFLIWSVLLGGCLIGGLVAAQEFKTLGGSSQILCSFPGGPLAHEVRYLPVKANVRHTVLQIVQRSGLVPNFVVGQGNVPNAAAGLRRTVQGGQERLILYNPDFLDRVARATRTDWANTSIIAHEIGHHLQGHTLQSGGSRPLIELEADEYSGFMMARLGSSLAQAQIAMRTLASDTGSASHPAKDQRLAAIARGWQRGRDSGHTPPSGSDSAPAPRSQLPPSPMSQVCMTRSGGLPTATEPAARQPVLLPVVARPDCRRRPGRWAGARLSQTPAGHGPPLETQTRSPPMPQFRFPLFLLFVLLGIVWLAVSSPSAAQTMPSRLFLLTEEEAAQLRLSGEPDRLLKSGPGQKSPPALLVRPAHCVPTSPCRGGERRPADPRRHHPLDLLIAFEPNREAVDMDSLEVRAKKGWFHKILNVPPQTLYCRDDAGSREPRHSGWRVPH